MGPLTVWKQQEDLMLLQRLSGAVATTSAGASANGKGPAEAVEPADRLAAWLLSQADVPEATTPGADAVPPDAPGSG